MKLLSRAAWITTGAIGLGSVTAAGIGIAAAATSSEVIHACVAKADGALHVVPSGHKCAGDEKDLSFNARGPRGLPGVKAATFQMYANVDAEADLGSNFDAVSASTVPGDSGYEVTFSKAIGHCAAIVQPGKAGGPDRVDPVESTVVPAGPKSFYVDFDETADNGTVTSKVDPFMLLVTCTS